MACCGRSTPPACPLAVKELEEENVLQLIKAAITMEKGGGTNG